MIRFAAAHPPRRPPTLPTSGPSANLFNNQTAKTVVSATFSAAC
jgi:hypothetical protein